METPTIFPSSAADNARAQMRDVSDKPVTQRRALAEGRIVMSAGAFAALQAGTLQKGDPLPLAEVAGIQAAKRTAEVIPLCHPLALDRVRVVCTLLPEANAVRVECEALATAKTGVEMEALSGVTGALLALYDVLKADDPALVIEQILLNEKSGGKNGEYFKSPTPRADPALRERRVSVVTVSDRAARGEAKDESGPLLCGFVDAEKGTLVTARVIADERKEIAALIRALAVDSDLVLLSGGTGLSPRDVTPEALEDACDRLVPGFGEAFRATTSRHNPRAWLSRAGAGLCGRALVVALPGSPRAVREGLIAIRPLLAHALHVAHGGQHG